MANLLAEMIQLQNLLTELATAEQQLNTIPDWMRELYEEHRGRLAEIAELETNAEQARKDRSAAETAIADAQEKLKRYQQQINQVSTQREYGALLHEIDTVKTQITSAEEQGLNALERREQTETKLAEAQQAFADLDQRFKAELARWEGEKPAIAARAAGLRSEAEALRASLPRGILAQFDRVRERNQGQGLAAIMEVNRVSKGPRAWHCSVCNYNVRPQVVVEVRTTGALIQCDGCKRILYVAAAEATA